MWYLETVHKLYLHNLEKTKEKREKKNKTTKIFGNIKGWHHTKSLALISPVHCHYNSDKHSQGNEKKKLSLEQENN